MIIQQEYLSDIFDEVVPMLADHWLEAEENRNELPLSPDWEAYKTLEDSGVYVIVTARIDGTMVGYMSDIIHRHIHYSELVANNDLMFLLKDYRGTDVFPKMVKHIESIERKMGVKERFMSLKKSGKNVMDYSQCEVTVRKYLGD